VGGEGGLEVFVADEQSEVPIDVDRWRRLAIGVLAAEGVQGAAELSLLFVDRAAITELNAAFMGAAGPTDVLAFPIDGVTMSELAEIEASGPARRRGPSRHHVLSSDQPLMLGDVVVCPGVALEQASDHAGNLEDEVALLVVHGVLHVLGYDHASAEEQLAMQSRERQLLEAHHWGHPVPSGFRQTHLDETTPPTDEPTGDPS
jgi:probable rRNA maturation factor